MAHPMITQASEWKLDREIKAIPTAFQELISNSVEYLAENVYVKILPRYNMVAIGDDGTGVNAHILNTRYYKYGCNDEEAADYAASDAMGTYRKGGKLAIQYMSDDAIVFGKKRNEVTDKVEYCISRFLYTMEGVMYDVLDVTQLCSSKHKTEAVRSLGGAETFVRDTPYATEFGVERGMVALVEDVLDAMKDAPTGVCIMLLKPGTRVKGKWDVKREFTMKDGEILYKVTETRRGQPARESELKVRGMLQDAYLTGPVVTVADDEVDFEQGYVTKKIAESVHYSDEYVLEKEGVEFGTVTFYQLEKTWKPNDPPEAFVILYDAVMNPTKGRLSDRLANVREWSLYRHATRRGDDYTSR